MTDDLRARIADAVYRHGRAYERGMYCECGAWVHDDDMATHRADAVMAVVGPVAAERDQLAADLATAERHIERGNEAAEKAYAQLRSALADRDRYRTAWHSAKERARNREAARSVLFRVAEKRRTRAEKAEAERDQYAAGIPLICADERHEAKVRGLESLLIAGQKATEYWEGAYTREVAAHGQTERALDALREVVAWTTLDNPLTSTNTTDNPEEPT